MVDEMVSTAFADLIGQAQAIELLTRAVSQNRIAPAYLFAGAEGVGRRLAAYGFAELLLQPSGGFTASLRQRIRQGNHPDMLWVEPTYQIQNKRYTAAEAAEQGLKRKSAPIIRLDQIREITRFLSRPPLEAPRSLVVIEQAEAMQDAAANALLKTLEEPGQATLILIAPGAEALLPTLVSRCQRIPFHRLSDAAIAQVLHQSNHPEILQHPEILALAQGSPGEAIAHWQQLQAVSPEMLKTISEVPRSLRQALDVAKQVAKELDTEAQLWLLDYLQHRYWQDYQRSDYLEALEKARRYLLQYVQPRLVWEVTLMRLGSGS
jgi:DNA polymerase III subunit delta'